MSDFYQGVGGLIATHGAFSASSAGTLLTSGAINTKGAYVELTSATAFESNMIRIMATHSSKNIYPHLVDIAIGPSGSEVVILPNLLFRSDNNYRIAGTYQFPITIPAGTRISARFQTQVAGATMYLSASLMQGGLFNSRPYSGVIALNANTSNSYLVGEFQTSLGSANTKSAWQEVNSGIPAGIRGLVVAVSNFCSTSSYQALQDVGIGPSGAEVVIVPDIASSIGTTAKMAAEVLPMIDVNVPAGTRVAIRGQVSATGSANYIALALYGVY